MVGDRVWVEPRRQEGDQTEPTRRMQRKCGVRRERTKGASVESERGGS
jgi:hypothetical protein